MSERRCPICGKEVEPPERNPFFPFCSKRCRTLDLGRWFGEEYRVPERFLGEEEKVELPDDGEEPT